MRLQVLVLERNPQTQGAGRKILVSGGARCNVLPLAADLARDFFTESSPSALRAVLASWDLEDCRRWWVGGVGCVCMCVVCGQVVCVGGVHGWGHHGLQTAQFA